MGSRQDTMLLISPLGYERHKVVCQSLRRKSAIHRHYSRRNSDRQMPYMPHLGTSGVEGRAFAISQDYATYAFLSYSLGHSPQPSNTAASIGRPDGSLIFARSPRLAPTRAAGHTPRCGLCFLDTRNLLKHLSLQIFKVPSIRVSSRRNFK